MTGFWDLYGESPAGCDIVPDDCGPEDSVHEIAEGAEDPGPTLGRRGQMKYAKGMIIQNNPNQQDVFE